VIMLVPFALRIRLGPPPIVHTRRRAVLRQTLRRRPRIFPLQPRRRGNFLASCETRLGHGTGRSLAQRMGVLIQWVGGDVVLRQVRFRGEALKFPFAVVFLCLDLGVVCCQSGR